MNKRGPFTGPIQWRFEGEGDDRTCIAYATHRATNEVCEAPVSWRMVKAEGWLNKDGSKWKTMPEQMFRYRSATFLARLYCPEVMMGIRTVEELEDIGARVHQGEIQGGDISRGGVDALADKLAGALPENVDAATGEVTEPADPETKAKAKEQKAKLAEADAPAPITPGDEAQIRFGEFLESVGHPAEQIPATWLRFVKLTVGKTPAECDAEDWKKLNAKIDEGFDVTAYMQGEK